MKRGSGSLELPPSMGPAEVGAADDVGVQLNQHQADYWQERLTQEVRGLRRAATRWAG